MTFTAKYEGSCAGRCGSPVYPGDRVRYVEDRLVHEGCDPDMQVEREARPVCPECFTEIALNGACSCV